jgi:hypothetical protein
MASIDTDAILDTTLAKTKQLAKTLFQKFADQATNDAKDFLNRARKYIQKATELYLDHKIDKDDLEDLILGKKDLAEMHALKQAGLAKASIDTFVNGVLQILLDATFAAVKI